MSDVEAVAGAVSRSPLLRLVGVEAFEGTLAAGGAGEDPSGEIIAFLTSVVSAVRNLCRDGKLDPGRDVLVSAGGSAYFDLVADAFEPLAAELPVLRRILRSGSYITHDSGYYERASALGARARGGSPRLEAALEVWCAVLSRPEAGFLVVGAGKRDLPIDLGLPVPTRLWSRTRGLVPLPPGAVDVRSVHDQHISLDIPPVLEAEVADLCAFAISHPCTAFDKWRLILVVDDQLNVIDAVRTIF